MEKISIVVSYYNQPHALEWFLDGIGFADPDLLELVVVDDCSERPLPVSVLRESRFSGVLVRIRSRIRWNIPSARNWGMVFASSENCLRLDIDHYPSQVALEWMLSQGDLTGRAFRFGRVDESGKRMKPHGDSFFMSRNDYWLVGGYDEYLAGAYGQNERDFVDRAGARLALEQLEFPLVHREEHKSQSGSRKTWRNKLKLALLNAQQTRRPRRLVTNVSYRKF